MIINHNISTVNGQRILRFSSARLDKSMEKLASGVRINRAGDDALGLALSEKMRVQVRGLKQAEVNVGTDISFVQSAQGYLEEIQSSLQRLRVLAVQSANGIYSSTDRMQIQVEVSQIIDELDRVASHAQFNELNLLTGRFARPTATNIETQSMWFHIGPRADQRERVYLGTMNSQALGLKNALGKAHAATFISFSSIDSANVAISLIDKAVESISSQRAQLGAYQNRLELTSKELMITFENVQAFESGIRDTDMAETTIELVKNQILLESGTAMLAQANTKPNLILKLLLK